MLQAQKCHLAEQEQPFLPGVRIDVSALPTVEICDFRGNGKPNFGSEDLGVSSEKPYFSLLEGELPLLLCGEAVTPI